MTTTFGIFIYLKTNLFYAKNHIVKIDKKKQIKKFTYIQNISKGCFIICRSNNTSTYNKTISLMAFFNKKYESFKFTNFKQ